MTPARRTRTTVRSTPRTRTRTLRALIEPVEPRQLLSNTLYVDAAAPGPTHDGSAWASAYTDLQSALTAAAPLDTIKVAQGTYKPTATTDRTISFVVKRGVKLQGSYAGAASPTPDARDFVRHPTILSGDIGAPNDPADNSYHVLTTIAGATAVTTLDGLTISAGNANGTGADSLGGGAYLDNAYPTIIDCAFDANSATSGGAIAAVNGTSTSGTIPITQSLFVGNSATAAASAGGGGAVYLTGFGATIDASTFANNTAPAGPDFYNASTHYTSIDSCIFWDSSRSPVTPRLANATAASVIVNYSDIQGGVSYPPISTYYCIDADPLFDRNPSPGPDKTWGTADDDFGDLDIPASSPVADAGDSSGLYTDYAGNNRSADVATAPYYGATDIGAFEAIPMLTSTPGNYSVVKGQPVTLTGHGASNSAGALSFSWDLNNDGVFADATAAVTTLDTANLTVGTHTISLKVTDSYNSSVTASGTVTVLPNVLYVDPRATAGDQSGSSWQNAFTDLQSALANVLPYQSLHVATGTYRPTPADGDPYATFALQNNVTLAGGYAGLSNPANPDARDLTLYPSTLSGDISGLNHPSRNVFHVLTAPTGTTTSAVLDGFTVANGDAAGNANDPGYGGAIYFASAAAATIDNTTFTDNKANGGGAVFVTCGTPAFNNCTFTDNFSLAYPGGGAVCIAATNNGTAIPFTNCTFSSNVTYGAGGAIELQNGGPAAADLDSCTFAHNSAGNGAAVHLESYAYVHVTDSSFSDNAGEAIDAASSSVVIATGATFARNTGGAIFIVAGGTGESTPLQLDRCTFLANGGSDVSAVTTTVTSRITNSLFVGNGDALNVFNANATVVGCTFDDNALSFAGTGSSSVINSVVWDLPATAAAITYTSPAQLNISYSDIQGNDAGTAVHSYDPRFTRAPSPGPDTAWGTADDDYGDLRPAPNSLLIDQGDTPSVPTGLTKDLAGNPRVQGAAVDIGAYEAPDTRPPTPSIFLPTVVAGASDYTFDVTYPGDVDPASLGNGDFLVTGPAGYSQPAALVSNQGILRGSLHATYSVPTPGGAWDYTDNGTYAIVLQPNQVSDTAGNVDPSQTAATLTVDLQSQPTAFFIADRSVPEGSSATATFSTQTGPGPYTYSYDFDDDGTFEIANTTAASVTIPARYLPDGPALHDVAGRITGPGGSTDYVATISITNVAPSAIPSAPLTISEGAPGATMSVHATDPSPTDTAAGFKYSYDFNNDGTFEITNTTAASVTIPASYFTDGPATLNVRAAVTDKDGASTTTVVLPIDIWNVSPTATFNAPASATDGATGAVLSFTNPSDPSPTDTAAGFTYSFDFDADGVPEIVHSSSPSATIPASYLTGVSSRKVLGLIYDKDGDHNKYLATITVTSGTTTTPTPLSGTLIGTPGSYGNQGNTLAKAFDDSLSTYFDAPTPNANYLGLDLGANPAVITSINYAPRPNFTSRMLGGKFQAANSPTGPWTDLYTITTPPAQNAYTTATITDPTAYRYVRYLAPDNSYGNVAELQFFGTTSTPTPTPPTAPSNVSATGTSTTQITLGWTDNSDNETSFTVLRAVPGTAYAPIATLPANTTTYIDTPPTAGPYQYTVVAVNAAGQSRALNSATASTLPPTGTGDPALTGAPFGTPGSYGNLGNTYAKALDGNPSTYFDAPTPNANTVGLDLGSPQIITAVSFTPRANFASRMLGGKFQASNTSPTSGFVDLYTITTTPNAGATQASLSNPTAYRYVRYLAPDGSYGNVAELTFYGHAPSGTGGGGGTGTPVKLTGSPFGTPGSYGNQGNTLAKAFDGSLSTYFDAPNPNADNLGLDLGSPQVISTLKFAPRPGYESRMIGGRFQASNTSPTAGFTDLYTITTKPAANVFSTATISDPTAYRYIRYLAPDGSYGNVAELEFDGPGTTNNPPPTTSQLTGTPFGTPGSYGNQGNTLAKVFDNDPTTYFDAPQPNGDSVGLDLAAPHTITSITFAPRPNNANRMVGGKFQASNSLTGPWTDLFTITSAPTNTYTTVQITDPASYRYVRYLAPDNAWGNIAELQFFGT